MRDKLAIPTQSLNIYLVSLTYVSLSYNTRLSGGPHGWAPVPPKGAENWDLVGGKVAFKHANFSFSEFMKPGIEDAILECALRIVHGGPCCEKCSHGQEKGKEKKPGGTIKVPKRPRRRSSLGRAIGTGPDRLYLVRPKNPARSRSRLRSSVEIVKAGYDFGSDSGSDFVGSDDNYFSPNIFLSSPRHSGREANRTYEEDQSPRQESSARYESFEERRGGRAFEPRYESFEERRRGRAFEPHDEEDNAIEAGMRDARRRGYAAAHDEIQRERKEAIIEMAQGLVEETRASQHPTRASSWSESLQPDIRFYMEVTYGVIIKHASPEVERVNANLSRASGPASLPLMSERLREARARTSIHDDAGDSDISSGPDTDPEVEQYMRRESRSTLNKERRTSFAIPRHEYTPRTGGFEGRQTPMADQDREHSLREREMSLRDRENSMREREMALRERERSFRDRQRSMRDHDMEFAPRETENAIIVDPSTSEWPDSTRYRERDEYLSPEDHRRPMRRPSSYSGPEVIQRVREDLSDEDRSMYGKHEY
jgi:hypothetical protein